jgi:hypothetical protein
MARVANFLCWDCDREVLEVYIDGTCASCRVKKADLARRMHFGALDGLTVQERLSRIEIQLYDLDVEKRLKALEAKNATY